MTTDICTKCEKREQCEEISHVHRNGYCYRTLEFACGEVFTFKNLEHHCDWAD